ncbi:MAG: DNA-deoxyinosine glycosylase [Erysipelotrichaceae bacterium]|nr:DNA-deoxyinosine glycosylase [Erysipelotrichaceae bacterium]
MNRIAVKHPFGPFVQKDSRILILGSFPSVKSRENDFYYGHPQNRFWKVMANVVCDDVPADIKQKQDFLIRHKIALWDAIESCSVIGSSDASIRDVVASDLPSILKDSSIEKILVNGKTAEKIIRKAYPHLPVPVVLMPSTSPANATWSLERLTQRYFEEWIVVSESSE